MAQINTEFHELHSIYESAQRHSSIKSLSSLTLLPTDLSSSAIRSMLEAIERISFSRLFPAKLSACPSQEEIDSFCKKNKAVPFEICADLLDASKNKETFLETYRSADKMGGAI